MSEDMVTKAVGEIARIFEEYKNVNDERMKRLEEEKGVAELEAELKARDDAMTEYKKQIDAELAEVKRKQVFNSVENAEEKDKIVQKAFFSTLHKTNGSHLSEKEMAFLVEAEMKAAEVYGLHKSEAEIKTMMSGIDTYGGLFVPTQTERSIMKLVQDDVAIYRLAEKKTAGTSSYERPVRLAKAGMKWTGEVEQRDKTTGNQYGNVKIDIHTAMAKPEISSDLLEDAYTDMEAEIFDALRETFAEGYGEAFIHGDGNKKPRGLMSYALSEQGNPKKGVDWGTLGFVKTGAPGDFLPLDVAGKKVPTNSLIDLTVALKSGYRQGAVWLMNSLSEAKVRKLTDADGKYLWQPSLMAGVPNSLLGYPIELDENMPDFAADACPIAFGNFRKGYLVVERRGMRVIRDVVTKAPVIVFNVDSRIGAGVQNFEAIKLLKASA